MNKLSSKKQGDKFEGILHELILALIKEWHFVPLENRKQSSGSQFGKDNIARWNGKVDKKATEFIWGLESKGLGGTGDIKQIPSDEIRGKLLTFDNSSTPCDCWCIFSPFGFVDNEFRDIVDRAYDTNKYPFRIVLWTEREHVQDLMSCFPEIYKKVYKTKPSLCERERKKILKAWKQQITDRTKEGKRARSLYTTNYLQAHSQLILPEQTKKSSQELEVKATESSIFSPLNQKPQTTSSFTTGLEKSVINEKIAEAKDLLDKGKIDESREKFYKILGEIENKSQYKEELSRVYNNIGVASSIKGNIDDAIDYFRKAASANPNFIIAIKNLAAVHINKSQMLKGEEADKEIKKAEDILTPLLSELEKHPNKDILQIYLKLIRAKSGAKGLVDFIEKSAEKYSQLINSDDLLALTIGNFYLEAHGLEGAIKWADKACSLSRDVESLLLRGRVFLAIALEKDTVDYTGGYEDIAPQFNKNINLKKAKADFDEAMSIAQEKDLSLFYDELNYLQNVSRIWLGESRIKPKVPIDLSNSTLSGDKFLEAVESFRNRNFEVSYSILKSLSDFNGISYHETIRIARAYLYNGCPEIALEMLSGVEVKSVELQDYQYWIDLSLIYTLLGDKNKAIMSATRAREFAKRLPKGPVLQMVLSHFGAVMLHYANEEGGDRVMEGTLEFDRKFPELKVVEKFDFEKDKQKIIKMIQDRRQWAEGIKDIYTKQPIPSYFLQKTFKKPYVMVWCGRDPEMPMAYTLPSSEFKKELESSYTKGTTFVFDYVSLLNLSKANLLTDIGSVCPNMQISFSLFQKIQEELLQEENESLRRLWNFLRKNKSVKIVKQIPKRKFSGGKINDIFESWLIDTMTLAKGKKTVMVTDDFRMFRFVKSESITPINSWLILQKIREGKTIDDVMYSKIIGKLAEVFLTFLSFNGDDLYTIVAEDDFKLKARTYFLINQIFLPGSDLKSFSVVFFQFLSKMWRPGLVTEDKIFWLGYISNIYAELVERGKASSIPVQAILETAPDFGNIWSLAIKSATKEELIELKSKVPELLAKPAFSIVKTNVLQHIDELITMPV